MKFMIVLEIRKGIENALKNLSLVGVDFVVEHPENISHGDYSTNIAMVVAKQIKESPLKLAEKIKEELEKEKIEFVERIEIAKPGFINFYLNDEFFVDALKKIIGEGNNFGKNKYLANAKTIIEYTDPNPFKEFHIGHLMSNAIGESISRIIEWNGAEVKRACYQGDVGIHVARAIAHKIKTGVEWKTASDVAASYAGGSTLYESDPDFQKEVLDVNKKVYEKTDSKINEIFDLGRSLTLEYFETLYKILGTKFDFNFFESTSGEFGKALVHKHPEIFEESEGAIIYRGEKRNPTLHTRVFVNKEGIQTYEAKELGLAKIKHDTYPYDVSIVVTGNEINDYFRVLLSAMGEIFPDLASKTKHVSHGMLRLPTGKMSSRTGDVITAQSLIDAVKEKAIEKIQSGNRDIEDKEKLSQDIAVGAIKYSILRQSPGKDIIFDFDTSLSFDGDSGPYLQYTYARTNSIMEKAASEKIQPEIKKREKIYDVEKIMYRLPEIVERAEKEYAPNLIATYLIELSASFNNFYAENTIVDAGDTLSPHKIAITKGVGHILQNGLYLLGILAPSKM